MGWGSAPGQLGRADAAADQRGPAQREVPASRRQSVLYASKALSATSTLIALLEQEPELNRDVVLQDRAATDYLFLRGQTVCSAAVEMLKDLVVSVSQVTLNLQKSNGDISKLWYKT